ncbi:hypothetical protein [Marinobacter sp.]|uniref:hypothetical protein n=1 Tax=Marinobacter sp. TaxID=50741 RepID=UPI0035656B96
MSSKYTLLQGTQGTVVCAMSVLLATSSLANGYLENRSWQFQTSADKANKAFVLDIIEKKQGGFYDGFNVTNTNNITNNIGMQVNCNNTGNTANTTGNITDNGQAGPNTSSSGNPNIASDSIANSDTTTAETDGFGEGSTAGNEAVNEAGSQTTFGGTTNQAGSQTNSGAIDSSANNNTIDNGLGDVTNGETNQALNNEQSNSGVLTAGGGTACNFDGSNVTGTGPSSGSSPLN